MWQTNVKSHIGPYLLIVSITPECICFQSWQESRHLLFVLHTLLCMTSSSLFSFNWIFMTVDSYTVSPLKISGHHHCSSCKISFQYGYMYTFIVVTITTLFNCCVCAVSFFFQTTIVVTIWEQLKNKIVIVWTALEEENHRGTIPLENILINTFD
jgi:hypothetical protein